MFKMELKSFHQFIMSILTRRWSIMGWYTVTSYPFITSLESKVHNKKKPRVANLSLLKTFPTLKQKAKVVSLQMIPHRRKIQSMSEFKTSYRGSETDKIYVASSKEI